MASHLNQFFNGVLYLLDMSINFDFWPDSRNLTGLVDQKRRTLNAHRLFAIHILFDPDPILLCNRMVLVRQERKRQRELFRKFFVGLDSIGADTQNDGVCGFKLSDVIAKSARLLRTTGGVVARVKVEDDIRKRLFGDTVLKL